MMKNILPVCVLLMAVCSGYAQTKADYEHAIKKIGKFYNLKQTDSLFNMYSGNADKDKLSILTGKEIDELKIRYGKMRSYDYAGEENGVVLFKTEFNRSTHMVGLLLDADRKLLVFQFKMSSAYIDSLLEEK